MVKPQHLREGHHLFLARAPSVGRTEKGGYCSLPAFGDKMMACDTNSIDPESPPSGTCSCSGRTTMIPDVRLIWLRAHGSIFASRSAPRAFSRGWFAEQKRRCSNLLLPGFLSVFDSNKHETHSAGFLVMLALGGYPQRWAKMQLSCTFLRSYDTFGRASGVRASAAPVKSNRPRAKCTAWVPQLL